MTRAYALALGAGTQAFTVGFGEALFGSGVTRTDLMMGAAWAINLAVAEWFIRRPPYAGPGAHAQPWPVRDERTSARHLHPLSTSSGSRDTSTSTGRDGSTD